MSRSLVHIKGKLNQIVPPVHVIPLNDDVRCTDKLSLSRKLTRKEMTFLQKATLRFFKRNKINGTCNIKRSE